MLDVYESAAALNVQWLGTFAAGCFQRNTVSNRATNGAQHMTAAVTTPAGVLVTLVYPIKKREHQSLRSDP